MIIDLSAGTQTYIEDCEVCCRPIQIRFAANESGLTEFDAAPIEQ